MLAQNPWKLNLLHIEVSAMAMVRDKLERLTALEIGHVDLIVVIPASSRNAWIPKPLNGNAL